MKRFKQSRRGRCSPSPYTKKGKREFDYSAMYKRFPSLNKVPKQSSVSISGPVDA